MRTSSLPCLQSKAVPRGERGATRSHASGFWQKAFSGVDLRSHTVLQGFGAKETLAPRGRILPSNQEAAEWSAAALLPSGSEQEQVVAAVAETPAH